MNLVITTSQLMAIKIAAALGGIREIERRPIAFDKIEENKDGLYIGRENAPYYETLYEGVRTRVTWISLRPSEKDFQSENEKDILHVPQKLTKVARENLEKATKDIAEEIDLVYFALLTTASCHSAKRLIIKALHQAEFRDIKIKAVTEKGIKDAFKRPGTKAEINHEAKIAARRLALEKRAETLLLEKGIELDIYELIAIALISEREKLLGQRVNKINAKILIGDSMRFAQAQEAFSRARAEKKIAELPLNLKAKEQVASLLATTVDLFEDRAASPAGTGKAAIFLYENGYITYPFTSKGGLLGAVPTEEVTKLINTCNKSIGYETIDVKRAMTCLPAIGMAKGDSALYPLDEGTKSLQGKDKELYEHLCKVTAEKINRANEQRYHFSAGDLDFYAKNNIEELVNVLTKDRSCAATFVADGHDKNNIFKRYTNLELAKEFERRGIGTAEIICRVVESIYRKGLVEEGSGALTEKAEKILEKYPAGEDFISQCQKWERRLSAIRSTGSEFEKFLKGVKLPKIKPKEEPKEEISKSQEEIEADEKEQGGVACPICQKTMVEDRFERTYMCKSCNLIIPHVYEYEGHRFTISEEDIESLAKNKRTGLKISRTGGESLPVFFTLDGNVLDITNKSAAKCPVCRGELFVYEDGFECDRGGCSFKVPFKVYGSVLSQKSISQMLKGEFSEPVTVKAPSGKEMKVMLIGTETGIKAKAVEE